MVVQQPSKQSAPRVVAPHHIGIHVTSIDAALPFFVDVLGLEVAFRWSPRAPYLGTLLADPGYEMEAVVLRVAGSTFAVELVHFGHISVRAADARSAAPGTAHLALAVSDVDAMCRRVREAGYELLSDPVVPTIGPICGGKVVLVLGPDGVRVELIESPRWLHDTDHLP
ncbi:VOC family protein [Streptomyces sp. NPDC057950]|uniref:VOC family protein n=1 Tax=Streptomyces sp. NPDC057950 TaxID=3346288 RepID=UPI0036EFE2CE